VSVFGGEQDAVRVEVTTVRTSRQDCSLGLETVSKTYVCVKRLGLGPQGLVYIPASTRISTESTEGKLD